VAVAEASSARLRLPAFATVLLAISPLLLLLGAVNFLATGPRGYFDNAPTQAAVGLAIFGVGIAFLLAGLVLVGMRMIAQQQLDVIRTRA
jgi:hypothetical protein